MTHNASGHSRLLDYTVLRQRRSHPTQIDIEWSYWPAPDYNGSKRCIVGYCICDGPRNFSPVVNDFKRRQDKFCGTQNIMNSHCWPTEVLPHDKCQLDLKPWLYEALGRNSCPIIVKRVVEYPSVIRLRHL